MFLEAYLKVHPPLSSSRAVRFNSRRWPTGGDTPYPLVCIACQSASLLRLNRCWGGAGISTSYPSVSPLGYTLGPPYPTSINVA